MYVDEQSTKPVKNDLLFNKRRDFFPSCLLRDLYLGVDLVFLFFFFSFFFLLFRHLGHLSRAGFVQVMENLESHGILDIHYPGLESHEI